MQSEFELMAHWRFIYIIQLTLIASGQRYQHLCIEYTGINSCVH